MKKNALKIMLLAVVLIFSTSIVLWAQTATMTEPLPALADLEDGWNTLYPGEDTICSYGTEYSFHVYPAESDDVLIFFNGGGACWFSQICSPASPTFVPFADFDHNVPVVQSGIFDFENPDNPFTGYNVVFVPYCTGDVHLGNNVVTYELPATSDSEATEFTIFHNGYNNAMSALNWAFENFDAPAHIFVTGSSAGSIAAPFYAGIVAEQYPSARIVTLGDGSGGYRSPESTELVNTVWNVPSILPDWEEYADMTAEDLTFEAYYVKTAQRFPDMVFAQYNTAEDETQYAFLRILGLVDVSLPELLEGNYNDIRAEVANFATYTAGGDLHTILRFPQFYTYEVEGVSLRDWVEALARGEAVADVLCTDCDTAPDEE